MKSRVKLLLENILKETVQEQTLAREILKYTKKVLKQYGLESKTEVLFYSLAGSEKHNEAYTINNNDSFKIRFNLFVLSNLSKPEIENVVRHEVSHVYCMSKGYKDDHGPVWQSIAKKMNVDISNYETEE